MAKVSFFDKRIIKQFFVYLTGVTTVISFTLIFFAIPEDMKILMAVAFSIFLAVVYVALWSCSNSLEEVDIDIEGSSVTVKAGDIFKLTGLKVIAFNEYFDTQVDDKIISKQSLNGIFINKYFPSSTSELDEHITHYDFEDHEILGEEKTRKSGKRIKYRLGTICVYGDYIFTAFSKFDERNKAQLTMPEYLEFLINFWDRVNNVYAQRNLSVPIFGSGITRIKEHKNISDEDLLKIMLWTFRISEMRFKYPAKLTIIIHEDKIKKISLFDIKSARNGL